MKIIFSLYILALYFCLRCNPNFKADHLIGKWKCIRIAKSTNKKKAWQEYKQTSMIGLVFTFGKENILAISDPSDSAKNSSHHYIITDDSKFLMYGAYADVAVFHKIIELDKGHFKIAMNFDDTLMFSKIK